MGDSVGSVGEMVRSWREMRRLSQLDLALEAEISPHIANLAAWRLHLISQVRRQFRITRDAALEGLLKELETYLAPASAEAAGQESIRD